MNEFYRFRCESGDEPAAAELLIFAAIGDWEDFGEISAKGFARDLAALPKSVKRLDIHINSPGGSLFEANAIYSRLADHPSKKVVYVDGLAASAASIVAMVGHKIYVRSNANIMVHLPMGISIGNADDMRKMAGALDTVTESMINIYTKRSGQTREDMRDMLAAETWLTAEQAVEKGFADEVRGVVKAAAMTDPLHAVFNGVEFDLSRFHNTPAFSAKPKGKSMAKVKAQTASDEDEPTPTPTPTPEPAPKPEPAPPESKPAAQKKTEEDDDDEEEMEKEKEKMMKKKAEGFAQGIETERARIAALQKLDRPATHDIIMKAIAEGKTVSDVIGDVMAALDKASTQAARRGDAAVLDGIPGSDGGTAADGNDFASRLKSSVAAKLKARRSPVMMNSRN